VAVFDVVTPSLRRRDRAGQQRFGTSFQRFDPTPENEARAFRSVEEMIGRTGGEVAETHVGRPSAERPMGKEEWRALLDPPGTRKKMRTAERRYERYVDLAARRP
jgi:hypothetical protein